jgi:transcriptional regulator with XRE-family HTH domain
MGTREFGRLTKAGRHQRRLSKSELARQLGRLPDSGRVFDAAGISRIEAGGPVRLDRELVQRLVDVLDLDPADAWHAAGLWPPDLSADDYRVFAAVGGAAGSAAVVQLPGTKRNRSPYALRLVRAA